MHRLRQDRLRDVLGSGCVRSSDEHDWRQARAKLSPHGGEERGAIHPRHLPVHQYQAGVIVDDFECLLGARNSEGSVTEGLQQIDEGGATVVVIVDYEYR
jgi:hypothetical protein